MTRYISVVAVLAFALIVAAKPAAAAEPIKDRGTFAFSGPIVDCGSFEVIVNGTGEYHFMVWLDQAGKNAHGQFHASTSGTLSNSADPTKSVAFTGHFSTADDFDALTTVYRGLVYTVTVPGAGVLLLDAGIVSFDVNGIVFEGGPHQLLHDQLGDSTVLCDLLA